MSISIFLFYRTKISLGIANSSTVRYRYGGGDGDIIVGDEEEEEEEEEEEAAAAAAASDEGADAVWPYFVPAGGFMVTPPLDCSQDDIVEMGLRLLKAVRGTAAELLRSDDSWSLLVPRAML
eukprot:COSAG05_NODE_99_length_19400_cov_50.107559_12_plen_122_part_00